MSEPSTLYDEVSSLRRVCLERTQKLDRLRRRLDELAEISRDTISHLENAKPCTWVENTDVNSAAEWAAKSDYLVEQLKVVLDSGDRES